MKILTTLLTALGATTLATQTPAHPIFLSVSAALLLGLATVGLGARRWRFRLNGPKKLLYLPQVLLGVVFLLAAPQAWAGVAVVQAVGASSGGGSSATATLSSTHAGNLLVVAIWYDATTEPTPTITDNSSGGANYYHSVGEWENGFDNSGYNGSHIYYAKNIKGGNTTVGVTGPTTLRFCVYEISGADPYAPLNAHAHVSDVSGGSMTSPSITPFAGDIVIATCVGKTPPDGANTPFTKDYSVTLVGAGGGAGGACAHDIVANGSSISATFTASGNVIGHGSVIASFRASLSPITIANPSFEIDTPTDANTTTTITSWTGTAGTGTRNPGGGGSTGYAWATDANSPGFGDLAQAANAGPSYVASGGIAQGKNVAYLDGASSISQDLTATLAASATYVLSGAVGNPQNYSGGDWITDLGVTATLKSVAGSTHTALASATIMNPGNDSFGFWSLSYTAPSSGGHIGETLEIVLSRNAGSGEVDFDNITLGTTPRPTAVVSGSATICSGGSTTIQAALTGTGPWNVTWSDTVTQNGVATSPATRSVSPSSTTAYTVTALTDAIGTAQAGDLTGSAVVTVNPTSVGGSASSSEICSGSTASVTLSGQTGAIQKWQSSPDHSTWTDIASTANPYTTPALSAKTYYRAVVQSGVCSSANSAYGTVTVDPTSAGGSASSSEICSGSSASVTLGGQTGAIQKWQSSPDHSTWTDIASTANPYTTPALTATTYYRAVVQSGVCSSANSTYGMVTVDALPVAPSPNVSYTKQPHLSLKIDISALLTHWTGTSLSVQSAGPSSGQSGTVSKNSTYIFYLPPAGNIASDTIPYTVSNGNGCTTAGTIDITFVSQGGIAKFIDYSDGAVTIHFAGIPDYSYQVQRSLDSSFNSVTVVLTTNTPSDGLFTYTEGPPLPSSAYYRLIH